MATQKRRVIYLSDEDWQRLKESAAADGQTVSAHIRRGIQAPFDPSVEAAREYVRATYHDPDEPLVFRPVPKPSARRPG